MLRREFFAGIGSTMLTALATGMIKGAEPGFDDNPIGGYVPEPPKSYLFTDHRLILAGDIGWLSPEGAGLPVAGPPEPMVDAHAVLGAVPRGIRLVAQPATKTEPIEGEHPGFARVIMEDGIYRSWSLKPNYPPGQDLGAYSTVNPISVSIIAWESSDGFEWKQRRTSEVKVAGQTRFDGFTFFVDPHGTPDERYKAVYTARPPEDQIGALREQYQKLHPRHRDVRVSPSYVYCMYGAVSPDGLRWKPVAEPLMTHISDTDTTVYWDEWLGKYVMYTRLYLLDRRMVARAETGDFRHFGPVEPHVWAGLDEHPATDVYTNARTIYPGMPEVHLMFPMFYHRYDQTSDIRMFSSVDGIHWSQVPGGPVIEPGGRGEWGSEFIVVRGDLLPFGTDRVAISFFGTPYPHKYPRWKPVLDTNRRAWAWWPKGRLCAVTADEEGEFHTFAVPVMGKELRLNAKTRRAGEIRVGLVGQVGRSADDCDAIVGDNLAHPVHWKGRADVGIEPGNSVMLQFKLRKAELFGFEWV